MKTQLKDLVVNSAHTYMRYIYLENYTNEELIGLNYLYLALLTFGFNEIN